MKALINVVRRSGNSGRRFFSIGVVAAMIFLFSAADVAAYAGEDQKATTGAVEKERPKNAMTITLVIISVAVITAPFLNEWRLRRNRSKAGN